MSISAAVRSAAVISNISARAPYLTSETAVGYILGLQNEGVMATIKHFALNNQEWSRHHVSSDADVRTM